MVKEVKRPWGKFRQYALNEKCTVKVLTVKPNSILSKQVHKKRNELWIILDEGLQVEVGNRKFTAKKNQEIMIKKGTAHRIGSKRKGGRFLEVSFGTFDEKDEIRLEDKYGRK
jgi:mannose-6-phosphate isomerase